MRARWLMVALSALAIGGCGGSTVTSTNHTTPKPTVKKRAKPHRAATALVRDATPQPGWRAYSGPVPILVYHDLGPVPAGAAFPGLYVSDADFAAEMAWLDQNGYQAVTLDEVIDAWFHGGTLPAKPIVITFDNGYQEQVTFAPRVMARYGWPGVLNEITQDHLHPDQIRPIIKLGWEVDSHSLTHPNLTALDSAELTAQVAGSRTYLQRTFHIPVNSFCYPSSRYDDAVIAAVKAAGYTNATTEAHAYATSAEPYLLPRFEIKGGVSELAADLTQTRPSDYGW